MDTSPLRKKKQALPEESAGEPLEKLKTPVTITQDSGMLDLPFLLLTVLLVIIGLIMLFSASYPRASTESGNGAYYFLRQLGFALPGLGFMYLVSRLNYEWLRPVSNWILLGCTLLLVLVLIPGVGVTKGGSTRWLHLGIDFQPSELAKAGVVIYFASMSIKFGDKMKDFRYGFLFFFVILAVEALLMLKEPHLSGTVIIVGTGLCMMFLGGVPIKHFLLVFGPVLALIILGVIFVPEKLTALLMNYAQDRITAWQDPEAYASDEGYQIVQSLYAIGSGGLMGLGLGKSRQKYLYLPEEHNDYIFPIICEELGFVGAVLILVLFAMLIIRGYWISLHAKSKFGALLSAGFTTLLAIQVFLNIGVVTNFLPSTGISLPFFSYGGTALLLNLAEMGVILGVSRQKKPKLE